MKIKQAIQLFIVAIVFMVAGFAIGAEYQQHQDFDTWQSIMLNGKVYGFAGNGETVYAVPFDKDWQRIPEKVEPIPTNQVYNQCTICHESIEQIARG
jgi:hypothetical protein